MAANVGLNLLNKNLSFFTVPAAFLCAMYPHIYAVVNARQAYDNSNPRSFKDNLANDATIDDEAKQRITRAKQASDNGFETLGLYAAAVVAANQAGLNPRALNMITLGYVGCRIVYNFAYIHLSSSAPWLRTVAWQTGIAITMALFGKAGLEKMDTYIF